MLLVDTKYFDLLTYKTFSDITYCICMFNLMQEVSRLIGVGLSKLLSWSIDLRNPELEVGACFF